MAEPVSKLTAVPSMVADAPARVVALAQALAAAQGERLAQNPDSALADLAEAAHAGGATGSDADAAARLAYGLIFGMRSIVREYEAGPVVVELEKRAADGEISADDRAAISKLASERGGPALTALALSDAEHQAAVARDFARAGRALGVRVRGSSTSAREALALATRRQSQSIANSWALTDGGRKARIEGQLLPLLTSTDATLQTRGNLLLQDMLRTGYAFPDCAGPLEQTCPTREVARGPIESLSVKADIAIAVVDALKPEQLRALDPGSAAALMLAIRRVPAFLVRDVRGFEVSRMSNDWSFVSTGQMATPRDGLVWQVDDALADANDPAATAAANKLFSNSPPAFSYVVAEGRLVQMRYAPKGRR